MRLSQNTKKTLKAKIIITDNYKQKVTGTNKASVVTCLSHSELTLAVSLISVAECRLHVFSYTGY